MDAACQQLLSAGGIRGFVQRQTEQTQEVHSAKYILFLYRAVIFSRHGAQEQSLDRSKLDGEQLALLSKVSSFSFFLFFFFSDPPT